VIIGGKVWNPGEMRQSITLGSRGNTEDAGGFDKPAFTAVDTVWAKWVNAHGAEVWEAESAGIRESATVTIRYRSDINDTWGVKKGNVWFEIVSLDDIQELHELIEMKVKRWVEA